MSSSFPSKSLDHPPFHFYRRCAATPRSFPSLYTYVPGYCELPEGIVTSSSSLLTGFTSEPLLRLLSQRPHLVDPPAFPPTTTRRRNWRANNTFRPGAALHHLLNRSTTTLLRALQDAASSSNGDAQGTLLRSRHRHHVCGLDSFPPPSVPSLTRSSWEYLQHGITRLMTNLREGIDLKNVCAPATPLADSQSWTPTDIGCSTWASTRLSTPSGPHHQGSIADYLQSCA